LSSDDFLVIPGLEIKWKNKVAFSGLWGKGIYAK
jgi:hypothetical protein